MPYNVALKVAIIRSGKRQIDVAHKAKIDNSRFSQIVTGRQLATVDERKTIAKILRKPVDELFPSIPDEATA